MGSISSWKSADEAVALVNSGHRVFVGSGAAAPQELVAALCRRRDELHDVEVVHLLTLGRAEYVDTSFRGHIRHNAFFIGPNVRQAVRFGLADYTPIFLSEIPDLLRKERRVQVAMVRVSPPDSQGFCSLGIHVDIERAAVDTARFVLAEVSPAMPRTFGDSLIHVSRISAFVSSGAPLLELAATQEDEITARIGDHVASLVPNRACLQMGIGRIPDAALRRLGGRSDLGIHTEMFSDGLIELIDGGVVTNRFKTVRPGQTVTSFCMGTKKLYDFVDGNSSIEFLPSDVVNNPRVIGSNENVVAINSALQVDLTGQVCADSLGYRFYSGIGGQVDFIRGAAMSRGGKPIIALPSTACAGKVSRIVPRLDEGAGVVTSRGDVHYVVTEYGVAYLHGMTIGERALALIDIAHPDYRAELLRFVKRRHYVGGEPPQESAPAEVGSLEGSPGKERVCST